MASPGTLRFRFRDHRGAVIVHPIGTLDASTYAQLRDTLIKVAIDEPPAVLVDLGELAVPSSYSLAVFSAVWMRLADWPGVPLLLVANEPIRRTALLADPICRFVPVHPTVENAMCAVERRPHRRRSRLALPGVAASSALARQFVRRLCSRWDIAAISEDAAAVATELVENVIRHTVSAAELRLELRRGLLSVAVSDGDSHPAVLREAVIRATPSAGLSIVATLANTWGCTPTTNGKVVWAVLRAS